MVPELTQYYQKVFKLIPMVIYFYPGDFTSSHNKFAIDLIFRTLLMAMDFAARAVYSMLFPGFSIPGSIPSRRSGHLISSLGLEPVVSWPICFEPSLMRVKGS